MPRKPVFVEFVGLAGVGKTSIAAAVEIGLRDLGYSCCRFDKVYPQQGDLRPSKIPSKLSHLLQHPRLYILAAICGVGFRRMSNTWPEARRLVGWLRSSPHRRETHQCDVVLADGGAFQLLRAVVIGKPQFLDRAVSALCRELMRISNCLYVVVSAPASITIDRKRNRAGLSVDCPLWLGRNRSVTGIQIKEFAEKLDKYQHLAHRAIVDRGGQRVCLIDGAIGAEENAAIVLSFIKSHLSTEESGNSGTPFPN